MAKHELKALNVVLLERRVMDLMDNMRMLNLLCYLKLCTSKQLPAAIKNVSLLYDPLKVS